VNGDYLSLKRVFIEENGYSKAKNAYHIFDNLFNFKKICKPNYKYQISDNLFDFLSFY